MAKPRVFISSTFYDLRQVRTDLDQFIMALGYEPVRNEEGDIPYGQDEELEKYCYEEIKNCDILVSIIGGRFGSDSKVAPYSVTQQEIKTAMQEHKQVYIFVESSVLAEFQTYLSNKENKEVKYVYVDSITVYEFLEEINKLKVNNTIKGFDSTTDITKFLREQFAGLFKRFLDDQNKVREANTIEQLQKTSQTLNQLVEMFSKKNEGQSEQLRQILLLNHPIISFLQDKLGVTYKFYVNSWDDLNNLLKARGFLLQKSTPLDEYYKWVRENSSEGKTHNLSVVTSLFQDVNGEKLLKPINVNDWKDSYTKYEVKENDPFDLPF